jgi:hypothetical protein
MVAVFHSLRAPLDTCKSLAPGRSRLEQLAKRRARHSGGAGGGAQVSVTLAEQLLRPLGSEALCDIGSVATDGSVDDAGFDPRGAPACVGGAAQDVAKFADVPRPVVRCEPRQRSRGERTRPDVASEMAKNLSRNDADVAAAFAQRRDGDYETLEPME